MEVDRLILKRPLGWSTGSDDWVTVVLLLTGNVGVKGECVRVCVSWRWGGGGERCRGEGEADDQCLFIIFGRRRGTRPRGRFVLVLLLTLSLLGKTIMCSWCNFLSRIAFKAWGQEHCLGELRSTWQCIHFMTQTRTKLRFLSFINTLNDLRHTSAYASMYNVIIKAACVGYKFYWKTYVNKHMFQMCRSFKSNQWAPVSHRHINSLSSITVSDL